MEIIYTKHAKQKIKARKIPKIWVEETIKYSDIIKRDKNNYIATKKMNGLTLEAVYAKQKYIKVITCYFLK